MCIRDRAEVYALSLFFTALCFWAILKWDEGFGQVHNVRWLVLISFLMGLSVGVHLLNLLVLPVVVLVVYFRYRSFSWKGLIKSSIIGLGLLALCLFGFIQNGLWLAGKLELWLVNNLQWPIHSGLIFFVGLLFGALFLIVFTFPKKRVLHFVSLNALVFLIGFSSYALIIIRAEAQTPINLNDPSDVFSLDGFLNREQYGDKPLVYGPNYHAKSTGYSYKRAWRRSGVQYENYEYPDRAIYPASEKSWFPRMHSPQQHHRIGYQQWAGVDPEGTKKPTFIHNLRFLFNYQLGHMYVRYFMWNFAGRQNDIQGHGGLLHGNWLSGIRALDALRLGNRDVLHYQEAASKARNAYYLLPLLMGLWGIIYLSGRKAGYSVLRILLLLFLMTGPVIVFYLNQTPYEPRERDYAFVGSFYAFSMFIGVGVLSLFQLIWHKTKALSWSMGGLVVVALALPVLLLLNNYNDHDRSGRKLALNLARSYLHCCEPNAILFTYGDNDTYPLWYVQEVEGVRQDVRVINYGLMGADWCVKSLYSKINEADAVPLRIPSKRYRSGGLDHAILMDQQEEPADLKATVQFMGNNHPDSKLTLRNGLQLDYSPTRHFLVQDGDSVSLSISMPQQVLYKNDIVLLDILSHGIAERPIYFTIGASSEIYRGLEKHLRLDGMVFRLVSESKNRGIDVDVLLNNYLNKIDLGAQGEVYYDQFCRSAYEVIKYRITVNLLLSELLQKGRLEDAKKVIEKTLNEYPIETDPFHSGNIDFARTLWLCGMQAEAAGHLDLFCTIHEHNMYFYSKQKQGIRQLLSMDIQEEIARGEKLMEVLRFCDQKEKMKRLMDLHKLLGI
jgi:hypothetical protein